MCKPHIPDEEVGVEKILREWNQRFIDRQKELDEKVVEETTKFTGYD